MASKRSSRAVIALSVGLVLNVLLGVGKLTVGIIYKSLAVSADAFNNISDAAVSAVSVVAFALSAKHADRRHPQGHGRLEYIASLIMGMIIFAVAAEIIATSVRAIINPEQSEFSIVTTGVLAACIAVKLFMGIFYTVRNKAVKSDALKAAAVDSFSDCAVTAVVLISGIILKFTSVSIDAYASIAVSIFIIVGACGIIMNTVNRLMGERADPEFEEKLKTVILSDPLVLGYHDLIVHDYGAESKAASVHLELNKDLTLIEAHDIADRLEDRAEEYGVRLVVHCDPMDETDPLFNKTEHIIKDVLRIYDAEFHDLSIHYDEKFMSFDVTLSEENYKHAEYLKSLLTAEIKQAAGDFDIEIRIDVK